MNKEIKVLGHRGYRAEYPENTLLSFSKAFEKGAHGIECDVQKCKDGFYIVIHDDIIDNISDQSGKVADMTLKELKKADLGMKQRIPELEEFLKILPADRIINIELKEETLTADDSPAICDLLLKYLEKKNLIVSSFEHDLLPYFKEQQVTVGMLLGEKHLGLGIGEIINRIRIIKPEYLNLPVEIFDYINKYAVYVMVRLLKVFKKRIIFWTVNSGSQFEMISGISDMIITDDVPGILKRVNG